MRNEATRKRFDELPEEAKNEFRKYADMLIDDYINSFARSQAIEFAEWMNIYNTHYEYFKMYNGWKHKDVGHQDGVYLPSSFLYDNFLAHQEKQKEGGII